MRFGRFITAFSLAAATLVSQSPPERMRDLREDVAAGKIRWLIGKWEAGEIDRAEATKAVLEAFEHPSFGARVVVFDYIDRLEPEASRLALAAELRRFSADLVALDAPSGPLSTGSDSAGNAPHTVLHMAKAHARGLFAATRRLIDGALATELCSFGERVSLPVLLEVAPQLMDALVAVGTRASIDRSIALYEQIETVLLPVLRQKLNVAKMSVYLRISLITDAEVYLRELHGAVGRAFAGKSLPIPKFKLTAASAPEFRKLAKSHRQRFPDRLDAEAKKSGAAAEPAAGAKKK